MKTNLYDRYVNELCRKFVRGNKFVFDCGCGDAAKSKIIYKYTKKMIAGDLDDRTREFKSIPFRKISTNKYGNDCEFDIVTSFDVIEHIKNDKEFLEEVVRILKPGGIAIIGTPNRNRLSNKIISLVKGKINYPRNLGYHYESGGDIIHQREYTADDLKNLVNKIGGARVCKIYASFLGLYLPILGPVGFKDINIKYFKKYCQHLFLIVGK